MERLIVELLGTSGQMEGSWYIRETVDQWSGILAQGVKESSPDCKDGQRQHNLSRQSVITITKLSCLNVPERGQNPRARPQARLDPPWNS